MYRRLILGSVLAMAAVAGLANSASADRWSRHDGRWYYWNDNDARYYYNDGSNWYYSSPKGWNVYRFDGRFGDDWEIDRDNLEIDDDIKVPTYAVPPVPAPRVKIEVDD